MPCGTSIVSVRNRCLGKMIKLGLLIRTFFFVFSPLVTPTSLYLWRSREPRTRWVCVPVCCCESCCCCTFCCHSDQQTLRGLQTSPAVVWTWAEPEPSLWNPPLGAQAPALGLGLVQVIQDRLVNPARPILDYLCQEVAVSSKEMASLHSGCKDAAVSGWPASLVLFDSRCTCWRGHTWMNFCRGWESCLNVCCSQPACQR